MKVRFGQREAEVGKTASNAGRMANITNYFSRLAEETKGFLVASCLPVKCCNTLQLIQRCLFWFFMKYLVKASRFMSEFCRFVFCKNIKHHTNFPGSTYSKSDFVQYEPISICCIFTTFQKHLSKSIFCFCRQAFFSWSRSLSIPRQHYVS